MPSPVISEETWQAVKVASIKGVPDTELAEQFSITNDSIRKRRSLDPVWKAAFQLLPTDKVGISQTVTEGEKTGEKSTETLSLAQKVASSVSESIAAVGQQNRLLALQIASKGLSRASEANLTVKDWSDVKILADITAKLTGLEGGNAVQVNVITDGSGHFSEGDFPAFDVEG